MKKFLLWVLMVLAVVALLVGGTGAALYHFADAGKLPQEPVTLGETTLEAIGYDWQLPLLGDKFNKSFYKAPSLSVQKLGDLGGSPPALALPGWVTKTEVTLKAPDGTAAVSGTAADFDAYTYTKNGTYELSLKAWHQNSEPSGDAQGWYLYRANYTMAMAPQVTLSAARAAQGDIVALLLTGVLDDPAAVPQAETDLGSVTFRAVTGGWMGYIPVTYNAESGDHTIDLTVGAQTLQATLTVVRKTSATAQTAAEAEAPGAAEEYRSAIWPLYTVGKEGKLWNGSFSAPTTNGVSVAYGSVLMTDGQRSGTNTGITYFTTPDANVTAPQAGVVVYAGNLALTGGTVVIDHGCGVKSYLFGLETVAAQSGQQLARGDAVGTAGQAHSLIYELRIGSKSVDPAGAISGSSGLQYKENLG